jgi:hypothetical protein
MVRPVEHVPVRTMGLFAEAADLHVNREVSMSAIVMSSRLSPKVESSSKFHPNLSIFRPLEKQKPNSNLNLNMNIVVDGVDDVFDVLGP